MSFQLTATTIPCSLYRATAYLLAYMYRLIGHTFLSFSAPSIMLPCSVMCQWQLVDTHLWMAIPYHSQDQAL